MKLLKLTLITLLFSYTTTTKAQDASNDATWEETIGFLKKYKSYIGNFHSGDGDGKSSKYGKGKVTEFTINSNQLILKTETLFFSNNLRRQITILNFRQLLSCHKDYVILKFTERQYMIRPNRGEDVNESSDVQRIYIENIEMRARILKAFQHLAYLATKKREEERKASGDKF